MECFDPARSINGIGTSVSVDVIDTRDRATFSSVRQVSVVFGEAGKKCPGSAHVVSFPKQ